MSNVLKIISYCNLKQSNSLFDYDDKYKIKSEMEIKESCLVLQEGNILKKCNDRNMIPKNLNYIANVNFTPQNNLYTVNIDEILYSKQNTFYPRIISDNWLIVGKTNLKQDYGFRLQEGNLIKLGKVVFKVNEVSYDFDAKKNSRELEFLFDKNITNYNYKAEENNLNYNVSGSGYLSSENARENLQEPRDMNHGITYSNIDNILNKSNDSNKFSVNSIMNDKSVDSLLPTNQIKFPRLSNVNNLTNDNGNSQSSICRICLSNNNDDIILNICKCTGSVKYIHLSCLRRWLLSKINIRTHKHLTVYTYKGLECELCKTLIPDKVKIMDRYITLINPNSIFEYSKNNCEKFTNYIVLEYIKEEPITNRGEKKTVYIVNMKNQNQLKVGRSTDSGIRMTDISISRNHACFKLFNGGFYISDCGSKFGTHINIAIKQEIQILHSNQLGLQCGKFYLNLTLYESCFSKFLKICRFSRKYRRSIKNVSKNYDEYFYINFIQQVEDNIDVEVLKIESSFNVDENIKENIIRENKIIEEDIPPDIKMRNNSNRNKIDNTVVVENNPIIKKINFTDFKKELIFSQRNFHLKSGSKLNCNLNNTNKNINLRTNRLKKQKYSIDEITKSKLFLQINNVNMKDYDSGKNEEIYQLKDEIVFDNAQCNKNLKKFISSRFSYNNYDDLKKKIYKNKTDTVYCYSKNYLKNDYQ